MPTLEAAHVTTEKHDLAPQQHRINPRLLPTPLPLAQLNEDPACIDCPHCAQRTMTRVERHSSDKTDRQAILCCLIFGLIGACIPYCCHMYYEHDHFCLDCGAHVAHKPHDAEVQIRLPAVVDLPAAPVKVVVVEGK